MGNVDPEVARRKARLWEDTTLLRWTLGAVGARGHVQSFSGLAAAFTLVDRHLRCIDGRTPGGVHLAGSGMLLGLEGAKAFAETAQVDAVTYHDDCRAARIWADQHSRPTAEAGRLGRSFAEELATALSVPCRQMELAGTPGLHDELVVYYDGTGAFDYARVPGLPKGFIISRRYRGSDPSGALDEVRTAVGVALGDEGFGPSFTSASPLRLIAIGDPADGAFSLDRMTEELQTLSLPEGRAAIDGFTAPERR